MEPMTLGSPSGSPSPASSSFLPSFLIGESNVPVTPRNNTLSPTKGRTLAFAQSPRGATVSPSQTTPNEFNRSVLTHSHRGGFGDFQSPTSPHNFSGLGQAVNPNQSVSGPPTQGLFDSLQAERSFIDHPPNTGFGQNQGIRSMGGGPCFNQSMQFNQSTFNESYLNASDFNASRLGGPMQRDFDYKTMTSPFSDCVSPKRANFWITVYGFPQTASSTILSHFSQCGTIIDKIFPPQNGNWVHLKFSSRLECDKALNYHERIIGNNLMIGVTYCRDPSIVDKENSERNNIPVNRVRPLTHSAYQSAQAPTEVVMSPTAPKRSTGIMNKAMDMIFGW